MSRWPTRKRKVRGRAAREYCRDRIDLRSAEQSVDAEFAANLGRAQAIAGLVETTSKYVVAPAGSDGIAHPCQFVPRHPDILEAEVANAERTDLLQKLK